jgi:hypothetical protein
MVARKYVFFVEDVPSQWIFEHYLGLKERLTGQSVKMNSVFKSEKTPSMCLYVNDKGEYMFKDFSSSKGGNGVALVSELFSIAYKDAAMKIKSDYEHYINDEEIPIELINTEISPHSRYKLSSHNKRAWNKADALFWTQFGIGSDILNEYNVVPLDSYTLSRTDKHGAIETIQIKKQGIYGYFTKDGELYKIYQPGQKSKKFIKIKDYIQGTDQLKHKKYLMICSSLKDAMAFVSLGFSNIDVIAPDSENIMIPKDTIEELKSKYVKVFTIMDDDSAGLKSMIRYQDEYGIPYLHLQMSKDLSDSVKDYGRKSVKVVLYNMLKDLVK